MQTWKNTDKSTWERGEWDGEPDKAQWIHSGLDCLIVRGPMGALCGYVGVPESHPFWEKDYDDDAIDVNVHGGLTFADRCQPTDDPAKHICHTEEGAANKTVWWLGFDCNHAFDLAPKMDTRWRVRDGVYRDFDYVKLQVERLAEQLTLAAN